MNLEICEALIRKIEQILGDGRSVYYEGFVPVGAPFPRTTILYSSFAPLEITHGGGPRTFDHIVSVNNIGLQFALEQFRAALIDGDKIMDALHGRQLSVTLADGRSIMAKIVCQGGTSFRDADTKEAVVQHTYLVSHNG